MPEKYGPLTEREKNLVKRLFSQPESLPQEFKSWVKNQIELDPPSIAQSDISRGIVRATSFTFGDVGTSFPTDPVNEQLFLLVDSLTAPTYQWLFRYNADSTHSHKWEFIGGPPVDHEVSADEHMTNPVNTWSENPSGLTVGPSLTMARAGVYMVTATGFCYGDAGSGWSAGHIAIAIAGGGAGSIVTYGRGAANGTAPLIGCPVGSQGPITVTAGQTIRAFYYSSSTSVYYGRRRFTAIPIRVS